MILDVFDITKQNPDVLIEVDPCVVFESTLEFSQSLFVFITCAGITKSNHDWHCPDASKTMVSWINGCEQRLQRVI